MTHVSRRVALGKGFAGSGSRLSWLPTEAVMVFKVGHLLTVEGNDQRPGLLLPKARPRIADHWLNGHEHQ